MKPHNKASLDAESRRLDELFLLLGALTHCLWYATDLSTMMGEFCQILVENDEYVSVQLQVHDSETGQTFNSIFSKPDVITSHRLTLPLLCDDRALGEITVSAEFELIADHESHAVLLRLVDELARAILGLTTSVKTNRGDATFNAISGEGANENAAANYAVSRAGRSGATASSLLDDVNILILAIEQSPFGVIITNGLGLLEYCNPAFTQMSGYALDEIINTPALWNSGGAKDTEQQAAFLALQPGEHWEGEILARHKDQSDAWEKQIVSPIYNASGVLTHLVAIKHDIRSSKQQIADVEQTLLLREQALVSSSNGIMITRSDANDHSIVYVNPAFERITGYAAHEVIGKEGRFLVRDDLAQVDLEEIRNALRERREGKALLRNYRKDGTPFWNELTISPVKDASGAATTHFVSVINDVSERINYQRALEYQATHDSLTGLANRHLLNDRIMHAIAWAKRNDTSVGLLLLDLDHFKLINDGSGHGAGDAMLKEVAKRLINCVRGTDTVARLGGDEFVIILGDLGHATEIDEIAAKILSTLGQPFLINGRDVFITASIGVSAYPRDGDHGETLLRYADIAMYRVKESGRNNVRQFAPEMGLTAISRLNMESELRRALERSEFILHYQPKIDTTTHTMTGVEALIRWRHPQIGLVHPNEFIPLAEETGLILPLGEWVMQEACRQQVAWRVQGLGDIKIATNMSSRQFRQEDLTERIAAIFASTGADPTNFTIELTESMVMQDVSSTLVSLRALKSLGLSLSLDDFGTGYSSLSYLRRFPIDELKIDKSFINDIHENPDDAAIASAIIAMGVSLGLNVVAEGVEKKQQIEMLTYMGCHQVQGYFVGRPMDAQTFAAYCREHFSEDY